MLKKRVYLHNHPQNRPKEIPIYFHDIHIITYLHQWLLSLSDLGARCSSVVRAFAHGVMSSRIDPSW